MAPRRHAVLVGNSSYPLDDSLNDLRCPARDVEGLRRALESAAVGFEAVTVVRDQPHHLVQRQIHQTLKRAHRDEFVLIYFSGHGKLDAANRLHLCCCDTEAGALEATAVPVQSIKNYIDVAATRQVALVLDCCFSGAVGGVFAKSGVDDQLQQLSGGRGIFVVAASTSTQVAIEKDLDDYSLFTKHLIAGIESGAADVNGNGLITMDELYAYVHRQVLDEGFQEPMKWGVNVRGEMVIARTANSPRAEKRKKARQILFDLAGQGVLPDRILSEALGYIAHPPAEGSSRHDALLDGVADGTLVVGQFVDQWLLLGSPRNGEARGDPRVPHGERADSPPLSPIRALAGEALAPAETSVPASTGSPGWWPLTYDLVFSRYSRWIPAAVGTGILALGFFVIQQSLVGDDFDFSFAGASPAVVDFESGYFPASFVGSWFIDTSRAYGGVYSVRSPVLADNGQAQFELTAPSHAAAVSFYYRVSAEEFDVLNVYVNSILQGTFDDDGSGEWRFAEIALPGTGYDVVRWEYRKDVSIAIGDDAAWVDDIHFGAASPSIPVPFALPPSIPPAPWVVDFEAGYPPLSGSWEIVTDQSADGSHSLASPTIGDSETAFFELVAPPEATGVSFSFLLDTEDGYDRLYVYANGALHQELNDDGMMTWRTETLSFLPGPANFIRWEYGKDASRSHGADRVWVDRIEFLTN